MANVAKIRRRRYGRYGEGKCALHLYLHSTHILPSVRHVDTPSKFPGVHECAVQCSVQFFGQDSRIHSEK